MNSTPVIAYDLSFASVATVAMSTAVNVTPALAAGIYAVWALAQPAYIDMGSTALTATTGLPVVNGTQPTNLIVPPNGQIQCISTSSGTMGYVRVG